MAHLRLNRGHDILQDPLQGQFRTLDSLTKFLDVASLLHVVSKTSAPQRGSDFISTWHSTRRLCFSRSKSHRPLHKTGLALCCVLFAKDLLSLAASLLKSLTILTSNCWVSHSTRYKPELKGLRVHQRSA